MDDRGIPEVQDGVNGVDEDVEEYSETGEEDKAGGASGDGGVAAAAEEDEGERQDVEERREQEEQGDGVDQVVPSSVTH